jgi:hypothetical protein
MLEESHLKTDPTTGEMDITPILEFLKGHVANIKRIDAIYRAGAVPMPMVAEGVGRNLFQTMDHLSADDELFINCVHADDVVLRDGLELVQGASGLLLDGTAVWSLRQLRLLGVLDRFPIAFGTVQETFDAINDEPGKGLVDSEGGVLSLEGERLALREIPDDLRQKLRVSWREVSAALARGQTYSSEALAALPPKRREELLSFAGSWAAHAMAAAKQHGLVLWSDDRVLGFLAKEYLGVQRVWTQAVLYWLRDKGVLHEDTVNQASAELQARRYTGTFTNAEVVVRAAKLADWNPNAIMFERNLRVLAEATTHPRACVLMATALIQSCMTEVRIEANQNAVVASVLERLKARDRSLRLVHHVARAIPGAMQVNPFGAKQALRIIAAWCQASGRLVM